jgi:uncharacterized YccA/Bax inhibitor family protein
MLRSGSPAMKPFEQPMTWDELGSTPGSRSSAAIGAASASSTMTVAGTVSKTFVNLAFACVGALVAWALVSRGLIPMGLSIPIGLGLIAMSWIGSMVINAKPQSAKFIGPALSFGNGAWAAFISFAIAIAVGTTLARKPEFIGAADQADPVTGTISKELAISLGSGLIFQAILLTFGVVGAIAIATGTGILRIGGRAAKIITGITGGIMFVYLAGWVLRMFGMSIPYIHGYGIVGIGFSLVVVVIASLNVAMAFSSVLTGVENRYPKHYEWVAGQAIVSTVIWLYIEIVILLYKLFASRE